MIRYGYLHKHWLLCPHCQDAVALPEAEPRSNYSSSFGDGRQDTPRIAARPPRGGRSATWHRNCTNITHPFDLLLRKGGSLLGSLKRKALRERRLGYGMNKRHGRSS